MDDPGATARYCADCWELLREVHRPLPERHAKVIARQSKGRVTAYRCPHTDTDAWHLDLGRYPATEQARADEKATDADVGCAELAGGDR